MLLGSCLAALLAACAAGPAPRDHFYRMDVATPQKLASARLDGTVVVDQPKADALTNERMILYRAEAASPEVSQMSYHQWADSPARLVQIALIEYLREAGVAERVVTPDTRVRADYLVSGRLLRLERTLGARPLVTVDLELNLSDGAGRKLLLHRIYRDERPAPNDGVAAAVGAFNAALSDVFARFVDDLPGS